VCFELHPRLCTRAAPQLRFAVGIACGTPCHFERCKRHSFMNSFGKQSDDLHLVSDLNDMHESRPESRKRNMFAFPIQFREALVLASICSLRKGENQRTHNRFSSDETASRCTIGVAPPSLGREPGPDTQPSSTSLVHFLEICQPAEHGDCCKHDRQDFRWSPCLTQYVIKQNRKRQDIAGDRNQVQSN
jgi:hypothetical protein